MRNLNDYNVKFLPNTQTIDLELKMIRVGLLKESEQGYMANIKRKRYAFKFSRFKDYLIIASATQIIYLDIINAYHFVPEVTHHLKFQKTKAVIARREHGLIF